MWKQRPEKPKEKKTLKSSIDSKINQVGTPAVFAPGFFVTFNQTALSRPENSGR